MRSCAPKADGRKDVAEKEAPGLFPEHRRAAEAYGDDGGGWRCEKTNAKQKKKATGTKMRNHHHHHHGPERGHDAGLEPPPLPFSRSQASQTSSQSRMPPIPIPSRTLPGAYREGGADDDDNETMFPTSTSVSSAQQQPAHAAATGAATTSTTTELISAQLVTDPVAAIYVPQDPVTPPAEDKSSTYQFLSKYWKQVMVLLLLVLTVGLVMGLLLPVQPVEPSPETPAPSTIAPSSPTPSIPTFPSSLMPTEPPLEWTQLGQTLHGKTERDEFGNSICLSYNGRRIAVGSEGGGYVRVYEYSKDENEWEQLGSDIEGGPESFSFGNCVSLSADGMTLAVGDQHGGCCGQLHVYQWKTANQDGNSVSSWSRVGQVIDGDVQSGELGVSVSVSADGRVVAAGAWMAQYVRVYHLLGETWTQLGQDLSGDQIFGQSVSLSSKGSSLAVGTPSIENVNSSAMYIYLLAGDFWEQVGQTLQGDPVSDWTFGWDVSLSANGTVASCTTTERIRVFSFQQHDDSWTQVGNDIGANGENWWGSVLSPDGTTVACEGTMDNTSQSMFRAYSFTDGAWTLMGEEFLVNKDQGSDDQRRVSLSENGTIFAFGESKHVDSGGAGTARVFGFF